MITLIIALCSALGGGTLAAVIGNFQKRKLFRATEIQTKARTESIAVTSLKDALQSLNEDVIQPIKIENNQIKTEVKKLTNEITKFRKAIEKIPGCAHAASCPVSLELQNNQNGDKRGGEE